jgi:hypothetical protein
MQNQKSGLEDRLEKAERAIVEVRDIAQAEIDRLVAVLDSIMAETRDLLRIVYRNADAQTVRDVDAFLRGTHERIAHLAKHNRGTRLH